MALRSGRRCIPRILGAQGRACFTRDGSAGACCTTRHPDPRALVAITLITHLELVDAMRDARALHAGFMADFAVTLARLQRGVFIFRSCA